MAMKMLEATFIAIEGDAYEIEVVEYRNLWCKSSMQHLKRMSRGHSQHKHDSRGQRWLISDEGGKQELAPFLRDSSILYIIGEGRRLQLAIAQNAYDLGLHVRLNSNGRVLLMAAVEHTTVEHSNRAEDPSELGRDENLNYESDSDEGTSALALRRHVASDDEEDDDEANSGRRDDYYDEDLEHHEGGPPVDDDEEEEEEEEEEEYEDEGIGMAGRKETSEDYDDEEANEEASNHTREGTRKPQGSIPTGGNFEVSLEEKKDAEPFVVPTAGAFYMHDDRFRYNGLARPRRSAGGRKLWEAKDEKPWVHDRFEELKLHDEGFPAQGGRGRRGRGREGRVLARGKDGGHARGRERSFDNSLRSTRRPLGRGRGIRRAKMDDYEFRESRFMTNKVPPSWSHETKGSPSLMQNSASSQQITKPQDVTSKKLTISSVLKVSSPPFFPTGAALPPLSGIATGTSKKLQEKLIERNVQQVGRVANSSRVGMEREMMGFNAASTMRLPSNPEASTGLAPMSTNENAEAGLRRRGSSTLQQQLSKAEPGAITQQQQRIARAEVSVCTVDQSLPSQLSSRGAPPATQSLRVQSVSAPSPQTGRSAPLATQSMRVQPVQPQQQMQAVNQTYISSVQSMQSQALVSFPGKPAMDLRTTPTPLESNSGNGRGTQAGRGSVVYGSSSLTNGLRGAVQFAGQPQAGLGVPAVGVSLPGYANQPQFSFSNSSEVTWIPILASGASLGSNYNPPYLAVDGGSSAMYYTQQTSQASAFRTSLGDLNSSKMAAVTSNPLKPPQRTESDDPGQQRRRYSQMTFGDERR
ncbi:hypothetical protein GOP47_0010387 [Adiantum capillus-veneris]|uniref:Btz domain-containing protein n=1 Tax=Adiantum capillus-veneris TaxID=13818 RepID=A0A9D4ZIQ1_ADICA|nr:hypothetical protein GOP47_0010387 [Adiantum capillus-veneris]